MHMMDEDMMERHMAGLRGLSAPFGPEVEKWCEDRWGVSDSPAQGASYIMHDGKFLRVGELSSPYRRDDSAIHADVERDILMNCPFVDPAGFGYPGLRSGEGAEGLELPEPFILEWLGCIRLNSGEGYIDLPAERPNSRMQSALALWLGGLPDGGSIEVSCWKSSGGENIGIARIGLNGSLDPEKAVRSLMSYYSLGYVRESLGRGGGAESVLKPCLRRMNRSMEGTGCGMHMKYTGESLLGESKQDLANLEKFAGKGYADRFMTIRDRIPGKSDRDIYYWMKGSPEDFKAFVRNWEQELKDRDAHKANAIRGDYVIASNSSYKVHYIANWEAANRAAGCRTGWCIAGSDDGQEFFSNYSSGGAEFYYMVPKVSRASDYYAIEYYPETQEYNIWSADDYRVPCIPGDVPPFRTLDGGRKPTMGPDGKLEYTFGGPVIDASKPLPWITKLVCRELKCSPSDIIRMYPYYDIDCETIEEYGKVFLGMDMRDGRKRHGVIYEQAFYEWKDGEFVSPKGRKLQESLESPKPSDSDILAKAVKHFGILTHPDGMKGYVLPDGRFMSLVSPDNDRGLDPNAMDRDTYTDYARHDNVSYWLDRAAGLVPGDYDETKDGSSFMERMGCVRCGGPWLPYIVLPAGRPSDSALRTLTGWIQDCSDQRDGNLLYVYAGKSQHLYRFADYTAREIASKISAYYGTGLLGESRSRAGTEADVGYRYEGLYGSGVRSLRDIVSYEVLELGNDDILDTVLGSFAMAPSDRKAVQDALDGKGDRGEAVKACLRAIRGEYPNAKYALWLCDSPEDVISSYSEDGDGGEQISRDDIDAYPKGLPKPISDLGDEGKLWAYNDMPDDMIIQ